MYGEEVENGELVVEMALADAKLSSRSDVLLVVGTSLQIPGVIDIIKVVGQEVKNSGGHVIFLDLRDPPVRLANLFTLCIKSDCQEIAKELMEAMGVLSEESLAEENMKVVGSSFSSQLAMRKDMRPLWDWL